MGNPNKPNHQPSSYLHRHHMSTDLKSTSVKPNLFGNKEEPPSNHTKAAEDAISAALS
jgi:hypothetical protein